MAYLLAVLFLVPGVLLLWLSRKGKDLPMRQVIGGALTVTGIGAAVLVTIAYLGG